MAKQSGLGDNFYLAGYDLSGDINSLGRVGGGPSAIEVTGIDKFAFERLGGLRDGALEFVSYFNASAGQAHPRLSSLPTTDVIATYCRGTTIGDPSASLIGKQANYDGSRDDSGAFTFDAEIRANGYGIEWGRQLTAGKRTDTSATNGSGVDLGAGSLAFGLQAYLHVFAFTGTSVTIKLQESSDNSGDAYADVVGGGFAAATAVGSQRIQTSRTLTVERYLRVVTTGTFSNAVFAVSVVRNPVSVVF
jgi:hypothetical protein